MRTVQATAGLTHVRTMAGALRCVLANLAAPRVLAERLGPSSRLGSGGGRSYGGATMGELTQALSLTALVAAALEYAILIRHRRERADFGQLEAGATREALLRMRELDRPWLARRWAQQGFRRYRPPET
jgi:hypothetical protein